MRTFKDRDEALAFVQGLPWGNAAGCCKSVAQTRAYAETGMPHVTYGSIVPQMNPGNPGNNFWFDEATGNAFNSLGLPDKGIEAHVLDLHRCKEAAHKNGAEFWCSISAAKEFTPQMYLDMAERLRAGQCADGIEGNFSCPNVDDSSGKRKPNVSFDIPSLDEGVAALKAGAGALPVKIKIAPITEPRILSDIVAICLKHRVEYIVAANTLGNCYAEKKDGSPAVDAILGGMSGAGLRPIVRGMLKLMSPQLKGTSTKVIATGGNETGEHVYEYLRLGAHGFGFNTVLTRNDYDPDVVSKMILGDEAAGLKGLVDILVERGLPD